MNLITKPYRKSLAILLLVAIGFFTSMPQASAAPHLIFSTEVLTGTPGDSFFIDEDGSVVGGNIDLNFGDDTTNQLRFNGTLGQFEFNQNVSFAGKQLINFRVENAASGTACAAGTKGQVYFDTDDNELYFCNGTAYVPTSTVADDSITGTKLADAVAGAGLIKDGSENLAVNTDDNTIKIIDDILRVGSGSITNVQIATDTIGSGQIDANAITSSELADDSVDAGAIATGAVGSDEIGTDAVGSDEISAGAVGVSEIGTDAVGSDEIANNSITLSDVAARNATYILSPSFPDYTYSKDGSNNVGSMSGDFDDISGKNYYQWSTKETGALQDYDIVVQWHIPENFTGWQATPIEIDYKTDTTSDTDNKVTFTLADSTNSNIVLTGGADLVSSVADTWVEDADVTFAGGTWTAGGTLVLRIKLFSKAASAVNFNPAYVGQVKFHVTVK